MGNPIAGGIASTDCSQIKHAIRDDIEGLRAIAVLAVILNHTMPSALKGGFAGVDIFFVISGFVIGKNLLEDIRAGKLSFRRFYARRARRLLPALTVMLVAVWGLGWIMLSGPEFLELGKHIVASSGFSNNLLLWSESGYFDAPSTAKPLLHLWSLGVEEQFYLLVPFLLWLGSIGRSASIAWALRLSGASLLLTIAYPDPSFYLLDTRFWELGAGIAIARMTLRETPVQEGDQVPTKGGGREFMVFAIILMFTTVLVWASKRDLWSRNGILTGGGLILAFLAALAALQFASLYGHPSVWGRLAALWRRHEHALREAMAFSGIVLIAVSLVAVTSTDWPGPQTLFPVLGSALTIMAGPATRANGLLASRPLVFIGGLSYPLYLWHWPAIVYWRMWIFDVNRAMDFVPVVIAVLLAWVTKNLVENPVRFGKLGASTWPVPKIGTVALAMLITGVLGASTIAMEGFPKRFSAGLRAIAGWSPQETLASSWRNNRCYSNPGQPEALSPECTPPKQPDSTQVLLWGDSHAAHLYPGLVNLQTRYAFEIVQWTSAGCPPTLKSFAGEIDCADRRAVAVSEMVRIAPDVVLLAAAWERYLANGTSAAEILAATRGDIEWLQHIGIRRIVLFGPGPTWGTTLPMDVFRYMRLNQTEHIPDRLGGVATEVRQLDAAMAAQASATHVEYVSVLDEFCDPEGCRIVGDRSLPSPDFMFRDRDHLTVSGSRYLMDAAALRIFPRLK
jgi:peptidoglycan/LPS O-acetylase OafA/YrhL